MFTGSSDVKLEKRIKKPMEKLEFTSEFSVFFTFLRGLVPSWQYWVDKSGPWFQSCSEGFKEKNFSKQCKFWPFLFSYKSAFLIFR